jgi:hypothetical protein
VNNKGFYRLTEKTNNDNIVYIKQYLKTFNDRRLREEYSLYTSLKKPTILENYFKDFIKNELDTRGLGI